MREKSLDIGYWDDGEELKVIDVGSGTGFTTEGIVRRVPAANVTCVDQSPHQMGHAKAICRHAEDGETKIGNDGKGKTVSSTNETGLENVSQTS